MSGMDAVLSALQTLYTDPSNAAKEQANRWLQSFQKEPEAWETANLILASQDAPAEPKLFAAQTFRTKIIYDLEQLPNEHRLPLRDTLLHALKNATSGPKAIVTQLCIALSDLLLQVPEWTNALQEMIDQLGSTPETVAALLEFLSILPQELTGETRIRVSNTDWRTAETGEQVVSLISMYFQAPGVNAKVRQQTLQCLASWLRAGEIPPPLVQNSPFFDFAFTSLSNPELFDDSIDLLCDLIHETQEVGDNLPAIQAIVPRLVALRTSLANAVQEEDTDTVRGYCRLFVEAGEWYAQLMLQHPGEFIPIVEAILDCSAYDDLDVVSITLNFWWKLAVGLRKGGFLEDPSCRPFVDVISRLVEVVIKHLRYPENVDSFTGQDRDDFRQFRHNIGDTLKDCCSVLGATACLARSFSIIERELSSASGGPTAATTGEWQSIEAALFSIRTMGAQVDPNENEVMPRMFAVIPQLPQTQSKIRYSATLVVGRYTEWLAVHPELIPSMLEYILGGFSINQDEVAVASASALKHLCQDCSQHLVSYLPPLFEFTQRYSGKLHQDDLLDIYSGYAHVIATMPPNEAIPALQTFVAPLIGKAQELAANTSGTASKQELDAVADALEQLNTFIHINSHLSDSLPQECGNTAAEIWAILSTLITRFGSSSVSERMCSTLRRGLTFFGRLCLPLAPSILDTVTVAFENTGVSGYVWVGGRVSDLLRTPGLQEAQERELKAHLQQAFERMTGKLVGMLGTSSANDVQDCVEDYLHLVRNLGENTPDLLFLSSAFPSAIQIAITAVSLLSPVISHDGLDTLRLIIGHDSLRPNSDSSNSTFSAPPPTKEAVNFPAYASAIQSIISQPDIGGRLVQTMLTRLLTDFHEDCSPISITLFRLMSERFPSQMSQWVPATIAQMPTKDLKQQEREKFLNAFGEAIQNGNLPGVRNAFTNLDRAARKERERMMVRS